MKCSVFFFFKKLMSKPVVIHFESKGKQLKGNGSLRFLFTVLLRTGSMEKKPINFSNITGAFSTRIIFLDIFVKLFAHFCSNSVARIFFCNCGAKA